MLLLRPKKGIHFHEKHSWRSKTSSITHVTYYGENISISNAVINNNLNYQHNNRRSAYNTSGNVARCLEYLSATLQYSPQELSANRPYFRANPRHTGLHTSPTEPHKLRLFCNIFYVLSKYTFIFSLIYNSLTCFVSLYFTLKISFCQMDFEIISWSIIYLFLFSFPSWIFLAFMISSCPQLCILHSYKMLQVWMWTPYLHIISEISLTLMEISHWNGPT